ncbi:GntR family transcriptional regulator [Hoyosella subflava]|uniref:Transcriptional regulator protein n=1 Tax=Hoyosella subflava (strain DSM 45089 / JCM 17490 / NBRC 109087 / DQS3-9A1) TaxID=443218 RepID=F6EKY5_HOYSD|nr:GntR family transcriptional regulator [Hoyosella subflava]AEF41465.1 Transcriptional regulator protein [Hoyosella subflava DQS3-9A1]
MSSEPVNSVRVPRATFASMVTERLRDSIISGTLVPGSQLSEVELATTYGVSRGPVREALQRLIQEGLLRSEPHRGVTVPVLSEEDVVDIYLARQALESAAVQQIIAASKSDRAYKELDRCVRAMEEYEAAGDWERVGEFDLEFHNVLVAASGSPRLQRMFSTVISETRLCLGVLTAAEARRWDLVAEHRKICELVGEGDTTKALAVLKKHFDDAIITLRLRREEEAESAAP